MEIIDLGINGEGVARQDGKVFFIDGGLIGESVEVEVVKEGRDFSFAKVKKVNSPSKDRVEPACPYFSICGGCDLQHMGYESQLLFKKGLVKNTLKKVGCIDCDVGDVVASREFNYRCKNVFPVKNGKIGMFKKNSHDLIEVKECKLANAEINKIIDICRGYVDSGVRYIVVQNGTVTAVVERKCELLKLKNRLAEKGIQFNININNDIKDRILSNRYIHVTDVPCIKEEFGVKFEINSGSFEQVNEEIKKKIYQLVLEEIKTDDIILDAYCGAGLLTGILAKKCKKSVGVDIYAPAIDSANKLKEENGILNVEFICGDCAKIFPNIKEKFTTIVLDPPRKGCDKEVVKVLVDKRVEKIIYISCSPISLAKDLKVLAEGYDIQKVIPFDMFPQTRHVETVVVLCKK